MNDLLTAIIGCLPLILFVVPIALGVSRLIANLFPKNRLLRRKLGGTLRPVFVEPFRQSYRAIRWLGTTAVTTNPDYRTRQLYLDNYPVTPLELYAVIEAAFEARHIVGVELSRVSRLEWHLLACAYSIQPYSSEQVAKQDKPSTSAVTPTSTANGA